jgi:hypothetical protein
MSKEGLVGSVISVTILRVFVADCAEIVHVSFVGMCDKAASCSEVTPMSKQLCSLTTRSLWRLLTNRWDIQIDASFEEVINKRISSNDAILFCCLYSFHEAAVWIGSLGRQRQPCYRYLRSAIQRGVTTVATHTQGHRHCPTTSVTRKGFIALRDIQSCLSQSRDPDW